EARSPGGGGCRMVSNDCERLRRTVGVMNDGAGGALGVGSDMGRAPITSVDARGQTGPRRVRKSAKRQEIGREDREIHERIVGICRGKVSSKQPVDQSATPNVSVYFTGVSASGLNG